VLSNEQAIDLYKKLLQAKYPLHQDHLKGIDMGKRVVEKNKVRARQGSFEYSAAQSIRMMNSTDPVMQRNGRMLYDQLLSNPSIKHTVRIMDAKGNHYPFELK